jgi:hypothetical protein
MSWASYGAPAAGDTIFVKALNAQNGTRGNNYRVKHIGDAVPSTPFNQPPFNQTYPFYYITSQNDGNVTSANITLTQFNQPQDSYNMANSTVALANPNGHGFYFNRISSCTDCTRELKF